MRIQRMKRIIIAAIAAIAITIPASNQILSAQDKSDVGSRPIVLVEPKTVKVDSSAKPHVFTAEEIKQIEQQQQALWDARAAAYQPVPTDPNARYDSTPRNPPSTAAAWRDSQSPRAPGDFVVYRDSTPGTCTVQPALTLCGNPNEPTASGNGRMLLYAGNMYMRLSADYGQTWTQIDPYDTNLFPTITGNFGGDQVVYYERTRGLMLRYTQYFTATTGAVTQNNIQLAVITSQRNLVNQVWTVYDITPQMMGCPNGAWFDYPDLATSNNRLYIATNIISGGACGNAIVFRLNLDTLASGGTLALENFTSSLNSLRPTAGAGGTMYLGAQSGNTIIRIYSWPEGSASPSSVDRSVNAWRTGTSVASSPDGSNWLQRDFHRILAAWVSNGRPGFMWDSAQDPAPSPTYPWPNVRFARFNEADMSLFDQGVIWNSTHAWAYPAAHPNDRGDIGGTIAAGGGGTTLPYPGVRAWIADSFNSNILSPLTNIFVADGTNGPPRSCQSDGTCYRWGDYFTARRQVMYSNTWLGTGYVKRGGSALGNDEPHLVWFGREQDRPPANNTIYVNKFGTSWQDGSTAHAYRAVSEGNFAAVAGDTLLIQAGNYNGAVMLDRPSIINTIGGTVVIGAP
jgi:hypothetical protein